MKEINSIMIPGVIMFTASHFYHDGLGGSLLSDQQHSFPLLHDSLHQEVRPHVVHIGNQDGRVVRNVVFGVDIFWDLDHYNN